MAEDWDFTVANEMCALRASGIVLRGDKILLDHVLDTGEYWLPGGHVKIGETTENALKREFQEEVQLELSELRLVAVTENFRHWQDFKTNFIEFIYSVKFDEGSYADLTGLTADDDNVEKRWVAISELSNLTICPTELPKFLTDLSKNVQHFVSKDF
ncbi:NUDIX hydrolase [Lactococcus nasutitermitis]|uniref:NUDIX hydrolase n=1 Tax=Lactococcus nasutitermitis TaxID=1652957 RepID=UPI001BCD5995